MIKINEEIFVKFLFYIFMPLIALAYYLLFKHRHIRINFNNRDDYLSLSLVGEATVNLEAMSLHFLVNGGVMLNHFCISHTDLSK